MTRYIALIPLLAACSGTPAPVEPAPGPTPAPETEALELDVSGTAIAGAQVLYAGTYVADSLDVADGSPAVLLCGDALTAGTVHVAASPTANEATVSFDPCDNGTAWWAFLGTPLVPSSVKLGGLQTPTAPGSSAVMSTPYDTYLFDGHHYPATTSDDDGQRFLHLGDLVVGSVDLPPEGQEVRWGVRVIGDLDGDGAVDAVIEIATGRPSYAEGSTSSSSRWVTPDPAREIRQLLLSSGAKGTPLTLVAQSTGIVLPGPIHREKR